MLQTIHQLPIVCIKQTLAKKAGDVDLWYYFYEQTDYRELLATQAILMTPDERERHSKLRFERDRHLFLATRTLVRGVLSKYASVRPSDWRFAYNKHGKPHVCSPSMTTPLYFSLSNTAGLVVCVVSSTHAQIGVDAERIDPEVKTRELVDSVFSPFESRALGELPPLQQSQRFFAYWTLKESYVKARGMGMALPLNDFWFSIDDQDIAINFDAPFDQDPERWRFALIEAPPCHMIGIAVDTAGTPLQLRASEFIYVRKNQTSPC